MPAPLAAAWGLASAAAWGAGDFAGALATKRAHPLRVALAVQLIGGAAFLVLALTLGDALPSRREVITAALGGLAGALGLTTLYAALAAGRMGIAAPISALLAALIPVAVGIVAAGAPSRVTIAGFVLALGGVALVAGPSAERPPARVLILATLAGVGFGAFYVAMANTGDASLPWVLVCARVAAGGAIVAATLATRTGFGGAPRIAILAALLDTLGNAFFVLAAREGRLDVAAVLSSLYPVATVLLARFALGERMTRAQAAGSALVLVAVPLIAL